MVGTAGDNHYIYLRDLTGTHGRASHTIQIDTQIIHGFTHRTHLLSTNEVRYVHKRTNTVLQVLWALRIEENVTNLFR